MVQTGADEFDDTALTPVPHDPALPAELTRGMTVDEFSDEFDKYIAIQAIIDEKLKDCVMEISGKKFRKKSYWRAVGFAFKVNLHLIKETPCTNVDNVKDWGYTVVYRATLPNGRSLDGDGSCFASEKAANQDTIHNVRAHAHTRAKNRAIADLVGFGEVTAEEVNFNSPTKSQSTPAPATSDPYSQPESSTDTDTTVQHPDWFSNKIGFGKYGPGKPGAKPGPDLTWAQADDRGWLMWISKNSNKPDFVKRALYCLEMLG